mmetsp:Transcript_18159/g.55510  ORF Transcript_18159/g.55510 Transcript_18159/m.55510 type:complete len:777 (+) Transcript_18159:223-2553(+)
MHTLHPRSSTALSGAGDGTAAAAAHTGPWLLLLLSVLPLVAPDKGPDLSAAPGRAALGAHAAHEPQFPAEVVVGVHRHRAVVAAGEFGRHAHGLREGAVVLAHLPEEARGDEEAVPAEEAGGAEGHEEHDEATGQLDAIARGLEARDDEGHADHGDVLHEEQQPGGALLLHEQLLQQQVPDAAVVHLRHLHRHLRPHGRIGSTQRATALVALHGLLDLLGDLLVVAGEVLHRRVVDGDGDVEVDGGRDEGEAADGPVRLVVRRVGVVAERVDDDDDVGYEVGAAEGELAHALEHLEDVLERLADGHLPLEHAAEPEDVEAHHGDNEGHGHGDEHGDGREVVRFLRTRALDGALGGGGLAVLAGHAHRGRRSALRRVRAHRARRANPEAGHRADAAVVTGFARVALLRELRLALVAEVAVEDLQGDGHLTHRLIRVGEAEAGVLADDGGLRFLVHGEQRDAEHLLHVHGDVRQAREGPLRVQRRGDVLREAQLHLLVADGVDVVEGVHAVLHLALDGLRPRDADVARTVHHGVLQRELVVADEVDAADLGVAAVRRLVGHVREERGVIAAARTEVRVDVNLRLEHLVPLDVPAAEGAALHGAHAHGLRVRLEVGERVDVRVAVRRAHDDAAELVELLRLVGALRGEVALHGDELVDAKLLLKVDERRRVREDEVDLLVPRVGRDDVEVQGHHGRVAAVVGELLLQVRLEGRRPARKRLLEVALGHDADSNGVAGEPIAELDDVVLAQGIRALREQRQAHEGQGRRNALHRSSLAATP